jgi:hypothetical protein
MMIGAGQAALAETGKPQPLKPVPLKRETRIVRAEISREACAQLVVEHIPDPDVEYKPGRDVYGRSVRPADLPGSPKLTLPRTFHIPLELDLRRYMGVRTPRGLKPNIQVGVLTVDGDRVLFNGVPLEDTARRRVEAACRKRLARQP